MHHFGSPRFNVLQVKGGADSRPPGTLHWKLSVPQCGYAEQIRLAKKGLERESLVSVSSAVVSLAQDTPLANSQTLPSSVPLAL